MTDSITKLLLQLGIRSTYYGFRYLRYALDPLSHTVWFQLIISATDFLAGYQLSASLSGSMIPPPLEPDVRSGGFLEIFINLNLHFISSSHSAHNLRLYYP